MIQFFAMLQGVLPTWRGDGGKALAGGPERRGATRSLALFWSARMRTRGWAGPATVVEISARGMRLRSPYYPEIGARVVVDLPGNAPLAGVVRWAEHGRFGMQFDREADVVTILRAHKRATGRHLGVDDPA